MGHGPNPSTPWSRPATRYGVFLLCLSRQEQVKAPSFYELNQFGIACKLCFDMDPWMAFGRPKVTIWSVWLAKLNPSFETATFATRDILLIRLQIQFDELQELETKQTKYDVREKGALAAVSVFEPMSWKFIRFRLFSGKYWDPDHAEFQPYGVGNMAQSSSF